MLGDRTRALVVAVVGLTALTIAGASAQAGPKGPGNGPPPAGPVAVGFGVRTITPHGAPPAEWAEYFAVNPVTGVWGEPFDDADGDGCYDGPGETHTDQVWNHA
ncbi:MAG TPA: hypothetical protein VM618_02485, partial [Acidimicrobiia bacterium]|nr:hypothetical protein [Acidimicrobiia bacterium]